MNDEIQTILFEDESMIRDYQAIMKSWFLKNVLKQYPKGKIVMILDNAKIHHAKLIQPFLKQNRERLELVFFCLLTVQN